MKKALQAEELGRRSENKHTRHAKVQDIATSCSKGASATCCPGELFPLDRLLHSCEWCCSESAWAEEQACHK